MVVAEPVAVLVPAEERDQAAEQRQDLPAARQALECSRSKRNRRARRRPIKMQKAPRLPEATPTPLQVVMEPSAEQALV